MPARRNRHAEEEGVEIMMLAAPTAILADERSRVRAIRCIRMELGEPDSSGRRSPVPLKGSEFDVEVDTVVFAIGGKTYLRAETLLAAIAEREVRP
jgi:glutamate synthase (NADPH/NADH) small chain